LLTQIVWRGVRARTLQERGRTDEAIGLAGEAVALAESTDLVNFHADALVDLALVFAGAAHAAESERAASRALELYGKKGNVVALEHVRSGAYARL
jgi:hypothetical protein